MPKKNDANFLHSETPSFVGRAVAVLAADAHVMKKYSSWGLAKERRFTDLDGSRPDIGNHFAHIFTAPPKTGIRRQQSNSPCVSDVCRVLAVTRQFSTRG